MKKNFRREERERKYVIYNAFSEYVDFLKNALVDENNPKDKHQIERKIQEIEQEMKKYYTPSVLDEHKCSLSSPGGTKNPFRPSILSRTRKRNN